MSKGAHLGDDRRQDRGQVLAFFAITLVVIIGMVGLIIDGGSTFVQRRDEQNVADAAAMAGVYAQVNGLDPTTYARSVAGTNGYADGQAGTAVSVSVTSNTVTVSVTRPHVNSFAGIMGFRSWDVSATATAIGAPPNGAYGAMPIIFNQKAFFDTGNRNGNSPASFGEPPSGTEDVPQDDATFNWTVFCTANGQPCNADSNVVDNLINGNGTDTTIYLTDNIAPLNAGSHSTLYSDLSLHVGDAYPVAIVDDSGALVGWAYFHFTGSVGGSTKQISGWFDSSLNQPPMRISPTGGNASSSFGIKVQLVN